MEYARFYNNYQFVEIFLNIVFKEILNSKFQSYSNNDIEPHDFRMEINKDTTEKERIKRLFQGKYIRDMSKRNLMQLCNNLLTEYNQSNEKDVGCALYSVRNLLVHRLYNIDLSDRKGFLKNINEEFNEIILELIVGYN